MLQYIIIKTAECFFSLQFLFVSLLINCLYILNVYMVTVSS